jgi:large subunit ribosomal protein L15
MRLHELRTPRGARRSRKRVGRGDGSGSGSFSGRGQKGQKSRSGGGVRPGFEGGQLPLARALPKIRGFTNIFKKRFSIVNVLSLTRFEANEEVNPKRLAEAGIVKDAKTPVKVLGRGDLSVPLIVEAHKFSESARLKIEAAGGAVREIG